VVPSIDENSFGPATEYSGTKGAIRTGGSWTHYPTTDSIGNLGAILHLSDATISSSIDRPRSCANIAEASAGAEATAPATGRSHLNIATGVTTGIPAACGSTRDGARAAGGGHGDDNIFHVHADRARLWGGDVSVENGPVGVAAGKALKTVVMPSGERRRGITCGVRDAGMAGVLPRRSSLGGPSLGIIGVGGCITSEE